MGNKLPPLPRKHQRLFQGNFQASINYFSPEEFFVKLRKSVIIY